MRRAKGWYQRLPQDNGIVIVIADQNQRLKGSPLSCDEGKVRELLDQWISTPKGLRITTKRDPKKRLAKSQTGKSEIVHAPLEVVKQHLVRAGAMCIDATQDVARFHASQDAQAHEHETLTDAGIAINGMGKPSDNAKDNDLLSLGDDDHISPIVL